MKRGKILIVDDNEDILFTLKMLLRPIAESITTLNDPRELLPIISRTRFDVILLDMNFRQDAVSGKEGFHWLEEILKLDAKAVVIFITAYADTEKAVQAIKQGATDFIPKPWQNEKLIATVSSALQLSFSRTEVETLKQQKETLKKQTEALTLPPEPTRVIGESAAMQTIFQTIRKFSETDANLLLLGENGTGKDLIARYVYEQSPRKNEIYVPIDLGSIPDTLFESELFGYEKGAFTDARKNKPGRVEVASGGTLFLNEIGNLSFPLQAKLLSVIEQRKSSRLGSTTSYPVDVRLICATNTDLYTAIDNGQFRQDLLYRINTIEIRIPPLRERGNDLFLLADFFLQRYRKKYKKELRGISREARKMLQLYRWPGNVRELEHVVERSLILHGDEVGPLRFALPDMPPDALPDGEQRELSGESTRSAHRSRSDGAEQLASLLEEKQEQTWPTLRELEELYIRKALEKTGGRLLGPDGATAILGIHYSTLRARMLNMGLPLPREAQKKAFQN